jgi:phosphotransferase system enzyme I (PtsP)
MGGKPTEAMALVALGLKRLSISPTSVGPVKRMIRSLDMEKLRSFLLTNINSAEHSIRDSLVQFARDHQIKL